MKKKKLVEQGKERKMSTSKIEWTQKTLNPITGCTKVSPGCRICYAEEIALRLMKEGNRKYRNGFRLTFHEHVLYQPYDWPKPSMVFVNSMSDLFHQDVPVDFIKKLFKIAHDTQRHTYQILTKRAERLWEINKELDWPDNIWMGVSVENQDYIDRIDYLRRTNAKVKFLSVEPLLGPLPNLNLDGIDWVIVGGESGNNARPMKEEWVQEILQHCREADVPFFFKQWGTWGPDGVKRNKYANGRLLNGRIYDEYPKGCHRK